MRRVSQKEIAAQLGDLLSAHGYAGECWGWGALKTETVDDLCDDCRKLQATLHFKDAIRCWRCAFWRHAPDLPPL